MKKIKLSQNFHGDHLDLGNGIVLFQGDDKILDVSDSIEIENALASGLIENVEKCKPGEKENVCIQIKDGEEVWVFAEQREGKVVRVVYELLGVGKELSNSLNVKLCCAYLTDKADNKIVKDLIAHGADKVYVVENEYLKNYQTDFYVKALENLLKKEKPQIVLFGATHIGRDFAPRIARRVGTGLTADCTSLEIDNDGFLAQTRPAWGGNLMATIKCVDHMPQMSTVRPGVMKIPIPDEKRDGEVIKVNVELGKSDQLTNLIEFVKAKKKILNLEASDIIVSGGRGLGKKENFKHIEELAKLLGGEVGASRGVVDEGWIAQDHQVGQTGKTVRPKIYMAFGISGAIQHRAGMQESDTIIAINKDPAAMIFTVADYGIIADVNEFLPALIAEIKGK